MTPEAISILQTAFERLDVLLPDARNFSLDEEGISFSSGRDVNYRGEYVTEWEKVSLTWEEFFTGNGLLSEIVWNKWQAARNERESQERAARAAEEKRAKEARKKERFLAPARKEAAERAKLAKLLAKYGPL